MQLVASQIIRILSPMSFPSTTFHQSLTSPLIRSALPVLLASASTSPTTLFDSNDEEPESERPQEQPISTPWDPTQPDTPIFSSDDMSRQPSFSRDMNKFQQLLELPRPRAILYMTLAMALHFGGYEFVRSGMLALFTSQQLGFQNAGAFSLAMGLVSPFSVLLLWGYGQVLQNRGPRAALRETTALSLVVFAVSCVALKTIQVIMPASPNGSASLRLISQALVAVAFVYQNSYAHLLYSQHWSFLSSVMTPEEGSIWFAAIAGMSSLMCTVTGTMVKPLVNSVGLIGTIACNCLFLLVSLMCADRAYRLSEAHGFNPAARHLKESSKAETTDTDTNRDATPSKVASLAEVETPPEPKSLIWKARDLFRRVPTLGALSVEVLTFQSMSAILNIAMVTQLKNTMPLDTDRAAWTGRLYAAIAGVSGALQFLVIPLWLKRVEPRLVWKLMPIIPFVFTVYQSFQGSNPALNILAISFFAAKTMDYSIRGVITEMVYQPLNFDSRYLGKEIIGVFGSRFGKSGVSLLLGFFPYIFPEFGIYHLSKLSVVASSGWLVSSWLLSALVPRKVEAQQAYLEQRRTIISGTTAKPKKDGAKVNKKDV